MPKKEVKKNRKRSKPQKKECNKIGKKLGHLGIEVKGQHNIYVYGGGEFGLITPKQIEVCIQREGRREKI